MDKGRYFVDLVLVMLVLQAVGASIDESFDDDDEDLPSWSRCPFIRNKLKNGRVKIRSRGRIAKFLCDPGFELAGKRFATCVRGQWNNPIPVCVSRGCFRPPTVANSRVSEMYRGAVIIYECLPGYTVFGGTTVYCDGRQWSSEAPKCEVATTNPQLSCDFEDPVLCGWSHDTRHEFDWKRNQFATPSGHVGTGPSSDHTFGPGKGGFYLYMEASSPRKENDTARLFSPVYPKEMSGGCFVFWYHMFGSTTGGLRVYVRPESHVFAELLPTWFLFGDQGNRWFRALVNVPQLHENFQIVIEGIRGSSYIGDTAIDDVSLRPEDCTLIGNTTVYVTESIPTSCRGRCREINESYPCGCDDSCVTTETCCEDFFGICTKSPDSEGTENPEEKSASTITLLPVKTETSPKYGPETTTMNETSFISSSSKVPTTAITSISKFTEDFPIMSTSISEKVQLTTSIPIRTSTSSTTFFITSPKPPTTSHATSVWSTIPNMLTTISTTSSTTSTTPATTSTMPATTSTTPATTSTTPATTSSTPATTSSTTVTTSTTPATTSSTGFSTSTINSIKTSKTFNTITNSPLTKPSSSSTTPTFYYTTSSMASTLSITASTKSSIITPFIMSTNPSTTSTIPSLTSTTLYTTSNTPFISPLSATTRGITYKSTLSTSIRPLTTKESVIPLTASPSPTSNPVTFSSNTVPHYFNNISTKSGIQYSTANPTQTIKTEETRRTYNLRPRLRTTPTPFIYRLSTKSTPDTRYGRFTAAQTKVSKSTKTYSFTRPTYRSTSQKSSSKLTTTEALSSTTKTSLKTTMIPPTSKEDPQSSKAASDDSRSTAVIVSVLLLAMVCFAGGLFYLKRWRARRQSKLADDSEMRFLYETEVVEYSDSSELDRINFNPPLI